MKALLLMAAMVINLNQHLNYKHLNIFQSTDRELCVYGGANAGKSYSIADKLLLQPVIQKDKRLKALVVKKTLPSLKNSVLAIMEKRAELFCLPLEINRNENWAQCLGLRIIFLSMNNQEDYQKAKSITDVDFVWINEITELREQDYEILNMRIRGGESQYKQMVFDFNPVGKTTWVYRRFFEQNVGDVRKLRFTVLDNPWAKKEEVDQLRALTDVNLRKIYFEGEWGELEGVIFNWDIVPLPSRDNAWYSEIFYGGDFGYSVDPAGLLRIYRKADEFWLQELIYKTGLTNQALAGEMKALGITRNDFSYWDSAEPKSIAELRAAGINAIASEKGPDSVRAGIDFLNSQKIHIVDGSENLAREARSYIRKKDARGEYLPEPAAYLRDHLISAARYGIYTHCRGNRPRLNIRSLWR